MNTWIAVGRDLGIGIRPIDYVEIIGRSLPECHAMLREMFGKEPVFQEALLRVRQQLQSPEKPPVYPLKPGARDLLVALINAGVPCAVVTDREAWAEGCPTTAIVTVAGPLLSEPLLTRNWKLSGPK